MHTLLVFLVFVSAFTFVNSWAMGGRAGIVRPVIRAGNGRSSKKTKRDIEEKKWTELKELKCQYLAKMFPLPPRKTCPAPPPILYQDIYTYSYKKELWEYQQKMCIPYEHEPTIFGYFVLVLIVGAIIFGVKSLTYSQRFGHEI